MANPTIGRPAPRLFVLELATFAAIFWADWAGYIPFSKTPFLFIAAWIFMAIRGVRWRSVGFSLPANWKTLLMIGVLAGVGMWLLEFFVTQKLILRMTGHLPDLHFFDNLVGNFKLYVIYISLSFVLAGIGEELVWRAYALPRVASLLGGKGWAWIGALIFVNAGFGLAHLYQDLPGVIENLIAGVLLGVLYLATGRNLIAPIAAHFVGDATDCTLIYLGLYPGVGH
ncbi:MAG TPA: type II CAAX endopeptidase family protein [Parvularculaceae bacterium]|nr:type II CAAX endopeptidase family protein [Parvularculaceae bacterium]